MPLPTLSRHICMRCPRVQAKLLQRPCSIAVNSYVHLFYTFELRNQFSSKSWPHTHYTQGDSLNRNSSFILHPTKQIILSSTAFFIINQPNRDLHKFSSLLSQSSPSPASSDSSSSQSSDRAVAKVASQKKSLWEKTKEECIHYWHGSKLLWADIKVAWGLTRRLMKGETLTRREHKQVRAIHVTIYVL